MSGQALAGAGKGRAASATNASLPRDAAAGQARLCDTDSLQSELRS